MDGQTLNPATAAKFSRGKAEIADALSLGLIVLAIICGNILVVRAVDVALDAFVR